FITSLFGQWLFHIKLDFNFVSLMILFLSIGSCVSFGVLIGFTSKNHSVTNITSQAFMMFISFLSPVMVDVNQLPKFLQYIAVVLPTTYVANAFQAAFTSNITKNFYLDILVLFIYFLLFIGLTGLLMDWRKS
ncbi:ABC transporter permease, partial [Bombilactobacillus bombi]|uniref:ABC transporter permease n=1 Tax=Bombilactobacillus bombi TaxID=1303590 RepID=UPI0015E5DC16